MTPPTPLVDTLTPSMLPTPSTAAAPDVVQVLPASSAEHGSRDARDHRGQLLRHVADPTGLLRRRRRHQRPRELGRRADRRRTGGPGRHGDGPGRRDRVARRPARRARPGPPQVNEFTYAPSSAPTVTSVSPDIGGADPIGQRDDPREPTSSTGASNRSSTSARSPASAP